MTKRLLPLLLSVTLLVALAAGCSSSSASSTDSVSNSSNSSASATVLGNGKDISNDEIKICFIPFSTAGQSAALSEEGFRDAIAMYDNVTLDVYDSGYDYNTQISIVNEAITQGYDAIIIQPLDGVALSNAVTEAEEAGIPVITFSVNADCVHTLHMQGNDYGAGWQAAEQLSAAMGGNGEGNYILLDCPAAQRATTLFGYGFEDYITNNTKGTIIASEPIDYYSQEIANQVMRDLLTKYDDIDVVYAVSDDMAMGALQAIEAAGRDGILVWGNEGFAANLLAIQNGRQYGTSWSDLYTECSSMIQFALYFIGNGINSVNAGYTDTLVVNCPMVAVTADNIDEIIPVSRWDFN